MGNARALITTEQATGSVLGELETAFFDIPFENSDFQNRTFVVAGQITPARAYRAVGLRMFAKIAAVKAYEFSKRRNAVDIDEKRALIADESTSVFDKRRLAIDIEQIEDGQASAEKLKNDALRELDCLYAEFKRLPKYTRAQFEAEEAAHYTARLGRQLVNDGAKESLANMNEDAPSMELRIGNALSEMKRLGLLEE